MKLVPVAAVSAALLTNSPAFAQNAGTAATAPSGNSTVSPATGNPANAAPSGATRPSLDTSLGAGIASGAINNGTTGDRTRNVQRPGGRAGHDGFDGRRS
jgi:hypothetical protein